MGVVIPKAGMIRATLCCLTLSCAMFVACRESAAPPSRTSLPSETPHESRRAPGLDASAGERAPSDAELCALPIEGAVSLEGARPFTPNYPHCPPSDPFCDTIDAPPTPGDVCFVANQNVTRAERESRDPRVARPRAVTPPSPWDGTSKPQYLDRIDAHFHLTPTEHVRLRQNGFVVLDRLAYGDYASAFHDVFQEQLPLYVSVDPMFHAVFRATETVLSRVESKTLKPALETLIKKLRSGLRSAKPTLPKEAAHDLDVYLGVAIALANPDMRDKPGLSLFGHDEEIRNLLDVAARRELTDPDSGIDIFGRARVVDFSQLSPRGHYADFIRFPGLADYFAAVMWLSRFELNLVSRSCRSSQPGMTPNPAETPREAVDALALAEIAARSGALEELRLFEDTYSTFAGRREDVSIPELLRLAQRDKIRSNDPDAARKLAAAIGGEFRRSARTHFMPEGTGELPAITTLLGPRIVPDAAPLVRLVHDRMPGRLSLGAVDVGYVLGHDRAKDFLKSDLARFPTLAAQLDLARGELRASARGTNLYDNWLRAILALSVEPVGVVPSFVRKDAYRDHRLNSALVGFGQLRHTFTLLAAQGYDAYGCEIPDGYVEPLLPVWGALLGYVRALRRTTKGFDGLERVLSMLYEIASAESSGAPLSEARRRWLGMVSEHVPNGGYDDTSEPPKWTGWYFDMFEDREFGAARTSAFVADYFTLTNAGEVRYVGAEGPRMGVFVVDVGGGPRAMVGPVAKGYETSSPIAQRLDDERALSHAPKTASWREAFAVPAPATPALGLEGRFVGCGGDASERRIAIRARASIGKVSVTLLDHHGDPLGPAITIDVDHTWKIARFSLSPAVAAAPFGVEALHVRVHDLASAGGEGAFDYTTSPSVFAWKEPPHELLPRRPRGAGDFTIGVPARETRRTR